MAQRLIALGVLLAACSTGQAALAQPLNDPTRPPSAVTRQDGSETSSSASSRLQSVLISSTRQVAVIDGRTVRLGERIGDATLVSIAPSQVILQRGAQYETLRMHPGVEKKLAKPPPQGKVNP
jgi:MSHA biogenesis protein MshK